MAGLEARIDGAAALKRFASQLKDEGNKGLGQQMSRALSKAVEPVRKSIDASAAATMPARGGYASLLSKSLRHRISRRNGGRTAQVLLTTYADGTKERRDLRGLEDGKLRHPVFRRRGRSAPWAVTSIRPGFHRRGTDGAMEKAQDALLEVIEEYAGRLAGR